VQLGAGLGHGGQLVVEERTGAEVARVHHEMSPGWLATLSGSWRVVNGVGSAPFVLLSATLGAAGARTEEVAAGETETAGYTAMDLRLGVAVGKTFFQVLSPYAAARVFGGPIFWRFRGEDRTGTDRHHYQLGLGVAVSLPRRFDVFAEGAPLGERAATIGAGVAF
jgi:hypothetical protein